ncbi:MAG TPA: penicillin-binding transpeptidase domain-containing protein [Terriglobales bacterium]|jgi:cell division protein FtsI (penicillin-binding protein 3)|nr:penicillin-binding transpeptidase domain-containing protein [Terriglobales bacterium]
MAAGSARNSTNVRLYLLAAILFLWGGAICLRLVYLQIFRYGSFELRAQHQQQHTTEVSARRGIIYDRAGHELAMSIAVDSVFAVPTEMPDLAGTVSLISRITHSDPRELLAKCQAGRTFCWLARKADAETADRIRSLNLRGIYFQKESKRFYPKRELAAQVIGYVGTDDEGLSGIEREFDDQLHGKPGEMLVSVDARRKWFGSVEKQPEPGQNVVLTIDQQIQYIAERELQTAMQQTHAEAGTVIVENPHTGEILALANQPTFNPNLTREITPAKLKNHAVSDVYEPGSTFKVVTISAALEEKLTTPQEVFDCQMGSIVINGMRIHDSRPHGLLSVSDVLAESSDVGSIKIGMRLGDDRFYKYIRGFGFGQQTGIELPGETRGLTKPTSRWSKVSFAAISMGQEIGITPLQLVGLVSTMANDGVWVAPRIVAATNAPQSTPQTIAFHPVEPRRVISALTAAQMRQMMEGVVLHGTGTKALLEGYTAAGKTGTAQKVDPATHAYSHSKYVASFAGFAPINNPVITVAVILDSAVGLHQGGQISAPVFQRVTQQVLEYLHTPHDVELPPNRQLLASRKVKDREVEEGSPDHLGDPLEVAEAAAPPPPAPRAPGKNVEAAGPGVVTAALKQSETVRPEDPKAIATILESQPQEAAPKEHLPVNGTVILDLEQNATVVPSFVGKSVRAAIEMAQENELDLNAVGSGLARDQSPAAGSHVPSGSKVTVRFGR